MRPCYLTPAFREQKHAEREDYQVGISLTPGQLRVPHLNGRATPNGTAFPGIQPQLHQIKLSLTYTLRRGSL